MADTSKWLSVLHPNLVSSPIKGILEILNLITRCIPMDILAWTDCVRSSAMHAILPGCTKDVHVVLILLLFAGIHICIYRTEHNFYCC
jgi:hypothetical protein